MPFIPPLDMICSYLGVDERALREPNGETVAVKVDLLRLLLELAASALPFNADWYVEANPDIKEAFTDGKITDLREHFFSTGFFEGRLGEPDEINEDWYLMQYADVRRALRSGRVESALQHYETVGKREWRSPRPEVTEDLHRWRNALLK